MDLKCVQIPDISSLTLESIDYITNRTFIMLHFIVLLLLLSYASVAQVVGFPGSASAKKTCLPMQRRKRMRAQSLGQEDPQEESMHGHPLQYSCLENLTDKSAWQAVVHRVTQSQTQLK